METREALRLDSGLEEMNRVLPGRVYQDFYAFLSVSTNHPIAVRSSSKLEDSHFQPFAGIYSTYMIPRHPDNKSMIKLMSDAIKEVYASVYYKESKAYMAATANIIDEEKMGIILQEVCGNRHGDIFYPTFSGVAQSINYYPIGSEKATDGIANVAFGKLIVEGGLSLRFSPKHSKRILQLSSVQSALRDTQKEFRALDMNVEHFVPSTDDGINILRLPVNEANNDGAMKYLASTYDRNNNILRDGISNSGKRIITFANILQYNLFPLADILSTLLELGQREMNNPIEMEFAVNLETPPGTPRIFNFLQIRPIVHTDEASVIDLSDINAENALVYSESALGNGIFKNIFDLIYVKPESFNPAQNKDIALSVERINNEFIKKGSGYVLIGPGLKNYRIDPSQGTHFFQNLTSFRVGYFTINPFINEGFYDVDFLNDMVADYEDDYLRQIHFANSLPIMVDGKSHRGIIMKPENHA